MSTTNRDDDDRPAKRVKLDGHEDPYADFSGPYIPKFPEDAGAIDEEALLPLHPPEVMQHNPVITHSCQEGFYHADTRLPSNEIRQDSFHTASDVNIISAVSEPSAVLEQLHGPLEQPTPKNQVSDEICFGMIRLTSVELDGIPVSEGPGRHLGSDDHIIDATINTLSDQTYVQDKYSNIYSILDDILSRVVQVLANDPDIILQAFIERLPSKEQPRARSKQKSTQSTSYSLSLSVILYGSPLLSERLGDFLNQSSIFVQRPLHADRNVPYRNPQSLSGQDEDVPFTMDLQVHTSSSEFEVLVQSADLAVALETSVTLPETEAPVCIRTVLYSHQKQALSFLLAQEQDDGPRGDCMEDCEGGTSHPKNGFWSALIQGRGHGGTNRTSGGILADAMGLGKSLSMISLIASDFSASRTSSLLTQPTLLVVPLSLLSSWENEFGTHLEPGTLRCWRYYGPDRLRSAHLIPQHHVVITTYDTVALEWQKLSCGVTPLFGIDWHRVILDEDRAPAVSALLLIILTVVAHEIRAGKSKRARAVCALRSKRRWAMTGTPIQNRWEDLASLLLFIRAYPDENLMSLKRMLSRTSQDMRAESISWICLRRSKASISLPPRNDELHKVDFDQDERAYYELANNAIIDYLTQTTADSDRGMTTNVLAKINSLRQICNLGLQYKTPLERTIFEAPRSSLQEQYDGLVASGLALCSCCSKDLSQVDEFNDSFLPTSEASDTTTAWISTCAEIVLCGYCFDIFQNESRAPEQNCEHQPICELVAVESSNPSMAMLKPSPLRSPPKFRALQSDLLNLPKDDK
ncbi:MAG: hypothetical protein Q9178_005677, partial [Gyalolechia marmorata]